MRILHIIQPISILFALFSLTMLPPGVIAFIYEEKDMLEMFFSSFSYIFAISIVLYILTYKHKYDLHIKEAFLIVVLMWGAACLVGSLPFSLSTRPELSFTDAIFEATSGLTATGATILTGLDTLPKSLLFYRQQLQFLGGLGVILLGLAILPTLGVGGMQLYRAEMSMRINEQKLTPKIKQSIKSIWVIYVGLTLFCAIAYWAGGMDLFDAVSYSFSTISTGGYTTHDQSIGYFHSPIIQMIAIIFMTLGAMNFSLHFIAAYNVKFKHYWQNHEFRLFVIILACSTALISITMHKFHVFANFNTTFIESLFHVISITTTTGFSSSDYHLWPLFIPIMLLLLGVIGGCASSTSGGIKMVRLLLLVKQGLREIKLLVHPHACYKIKFGQHPLSDRIINAIWGFLATYFALFGLFLILLLATGLNFITAYSATAASLANIGPGLGDVASNYHNINNSAKSILCVAMLIGRLELFTVLVLLSPTYWRS